MVDCLADVQTTLMWVVRGWCHGGRRPSSDDSLHSLTVIPPSALDNPSIQSEYHEVLPSSVNVQSHLTSSLNDDGNAFMILGLSSADGGMTV